MKKLFTITCLIGLLFSTESLAQGLYLKIQSSKGAIEGSSTSLLHPKEIEVSSFLDAAGAACQLDGSCAPASQTTLKLVLNLDISFVALQRALISHDELNVTLSVVNRLQDSEYDYLIIYLEDAVITGVTTNSEGDRPVISMTINAPKWHRTYKSTPGPGAPAPIKFGWNFIINKEFTH